MRRLPALPVLLLACSCVWSGPALAAEKLAPLDAEFLEFLATFGGEEEDWALFADEEPAAGKPSPAAEDPAAKRDESKTEAAAKPAEKR